MPEEIGRIEKPAAESFAGGRKLLLVPLIYAGKDAPVDYVERFERYWEQVESQIDNLEGKIGRISKIYHELISIAGEEGMKFLERLNTKSYRIVKSKEEQGAKLEATEDKDISEESMDWERCLALGFRSEKVASKIYQFYAEAARQRYEFMARRIDETLGEGETGIFFIREGNWVQFPPNIEVFSVSPPALDDIRRWLRER